MRSALWRDRGFLKLWAAQSVSQLGTQVSMLALPLAALYVLKASALGVSLLRSFAVLPFVLFSLPAGVWIDRLRRRPLMIVADAGRALAIASIPVAYWLGQLTLAQLYAVAGVTGLLSVVFDVSYLSFLPGLVSRDRLGEANAKLFGMQSVAQVLGPTLAGALVGAVGAAVAVLADAVSFACSGAFVAAIRGREQRPERTETRTRDELVEGLRYVFSNPYLRTLTIWTSFWNLFSSAFFALLVVYYVRVLHWGPTKIGVVVALSTSGLVVGALVNSRAVARFGIGQMIAFSGITTSALFVVIPAAPRAYAAPLIVSSSFVGTITGFSANVNQLTFRQSITPERLLGRMNSVVRFMYWGTIPIGSALGGVATGAIGLRETLLLSALGAALSCVPIAASPIRHVRSATVTDDAGTAGDGGVAATAH
jgi:predicted MFS family arabinose efflux permease